MMILNDKIRQEIVELLSKNIQDVKYFHNGRKAFTDLEQELPAIAVFIDEVYQDDYSVIDSKEQHQELQLMCKEGEAHNG